MTTKKKVEKSEPTGSPQFPWEELKAAIFEGEYLCWWVEKTTNDPEVLKHVKTLRTSLEVLKKYA